MDMEADHEQPPSVTSESSSTRIEKEQTPQQFSETVKNASVCETQSEGELLALCGIPAEEKAYEGKLEEGTSESPKSVKKTGRLKRKERRLRNEPQNITVEEGPAGVHVLDFAEARATELCSMAKALSSKGGSKLPFQRLPRHMRRRAASHDVRRLPRRLRKAAFREMEKSKSTTDGTTKKKASRKHKRNTRNLQTEYAQRQRASKWLETHMWHAKRMEMCDKYGYRLAEHCSDKGVKAAYMSLSHGCLLSDISYYCCTQVTGIQSHVITSLSPLFSSETGLTIGGKAYLRGTKEGKAVLYRRGEYPHGAIGPVQFLWQAPPPLQSDRASSALYEPTCLWVWSHPAMHDDVLSEITASVASYNSQSSSLRGETLTEENKDIIVRDLKSNLVRFRLIGPRSHALLMEALKPVFDLQTDVPSRQERADVSEADSDSMEVDPPSIPDAPRWWLGGRQEDICRQSELLSDVYPSIKSAPNPAQFTKGTVLGITVLDPRLSTPSKKTDVVSEHYPQKKIDFKSLQTTSEQDRDEDTEDIGADLKTQPLEIEPSREESAPDESVVSTLITVPADVAYSPIWHPYVRAVVSNSKEAAHILSHLRSKQFVPSSELKLGSRAAKIPVVLVQQTLNISPHTVPSHKGSVLQSSQNTGCGWDIILPADWGKEFWVSFIYHGARACGMKELQKCSLELLAPHFPRDFPDTPSGRLHGEEEKSSLEMKYMAYPPDKRRNYGKLLIASPFEFPWDDLVSTWTQESRIDRICHPPSSSKKMKLDESLEPLTLTEQSPDFTLDFPLEESRVRKRHLVTQMSNEDQQVPLSTVDHRSSPVYVLRSREALCSLSQLIDHLFAQKQPANSSPSSSITYLRSLFRSALQDFSIDKHFQKHRSALVGVRVQMYQRGSLSNHDVIAVPKCSDFAPLLSGTRSRPHSGPKEELHVKGMTVVEGKSITIGVSSLTRKQIAEVKERRKQEQKLLKKKNKQETKETKNDSTIENSSHAIAAANDFKLVPVQPCRETCGYVTSAGYRLSTSLYSGVGYCTFGGFLETLSRCYLTPGVGEPLALVRGESTQYWFVRMSLL